MIQLNDEQYWLYAAIDAETNELLHTTLEPTRNTMVAKQFLTEIGEKHDVSEPVFLIDGAQPLHAACRRIGYDFRYKKHRDRSAAEGVFREIKRRTVSATPQQRLSMTGSDRSASRRVSLFELYLF